MTFLNGGGILLFLVYPFLICFPVQMVEARSVNQHNNNIPNFNVAHSACGLKGSMYCPCIPGSKQKSICHNSGMFFGGGVSFLLVCFT